ncbi:MAG: sterol desaturase family protein [Acidobacteriota bacterium]
MHWIPSNWADYTGRIYWALFVVGYLGVAVWETLGPWRDLSLSTGRRWLNHGLLLAVSLLFLTLVLRVSPVLLALGIEDRSWGLLSNSGGRLPGVWRGLLAIIALDFSHYASHRLLHWSWFWRIHRVHHSDPDYDVSTALRFHPLEVAIGNGAFLLFIYVLAPPAWSVAVSQMMTEIVNFIVHANGKLPAKLDKLFRTVVVTPQMHRVHHSQLALEHDGNYGQTFSWWDRLLGTYREQVSKDLRVGLPEVEGEESATLLSMLIDPFLRR